MKRTKTDLDKVFIVMATDYIKDNPLPDLDREGIKDYTQLAKEIFKTKNPTDNEIHASIIYNNEDAQLLTGLI